MRSTFVFVAGMVSGVLVVRHLRRRRRGWLNHLIGATHDYIDADEVSFDYTLMQQ